LRLFHNTVISGDVTRASSSAAAARDDLRRAIIDAASRILAEEGPAALSVRRVASEVGASTMVVYTHFRDKDGLVDAVLTEAFSRFATALARVHDPDPWTHLRALGHAYRAFAKSQPSSYKLLWGRATPERPVPATASRAFDALTSAIARVLALLDRPARDVEPAALNVWAITHGLVSLELAGACGGGDVDAAFEQMLDFIESALRGR
jgi:AcrR family transcriptional regulator